MNALCPASWTRLRALLDRALELEGEARNDYVESLAGDDCALRPELLRMLAQHELHAQKSIPNAIELATRYIGSTLHEEMELDKARLGQDIGPYRLIRLLGAGGMGAVYLAERFKEGFAQQVALKLVRRTFGSAAAQERFERERQILASLRHPGIALLFDGGRTPDGQPFYTMEYVDGQIVTDYCRDRQSSVEDRVRLMLQIASALSYAHQNLIVHRDIKPSNVLIDSDVQTKLVDFGLAKLLDQADASMTQAGTMPMTPAYAAPEQFHKGAVTVATDIYQFGVLCYAILTERLPYEGDPNDTLTWARAVTEQEPLTLSRALESATQTHQARTNRKKYKRRLTRDLDAILRKMMAKAPAHRYASMDAVMADLRAYLDRRPVRARRAGPAYFAWRFVLRHRLGTAAAVSAFAALGLTTLVAVRQAQMARFEAERANSVANFLIGLFQVADPGVNRGERLNANQILERGAKNIETEMTSHPEQRARLFTVIGKVFQSLGDFPRAKPLLENAVRVFRTARNPNRDDFADALQALALANRRGGDHAQALALLDEELHLYPGSSAADIEGQLRALSMRGPVLRETGDMQGAKQELVRAIELAGRNGTGNRKLIGQLDTNLGLLLHDLGEYEGARRLIEEACAINREQWPPGDTHIVNCDINLGLVLSDLGDLDGAEQLLTPAAEETRKRYGDSSLNMAIISNTLGVLAWKQRRYELALERFNASERSYVSVLGESNTDRAWSIINAGLVRIDMGDYEAAVSAMQRAFDLRRAQLPEDHPELAHSFDMLSRAFWLTGRYRESKEYAEKALTILRARMPPDHSSIVGCLYDLGMAEYALGNVEQSKTHWAEAFQRAPRAYAPNDPELIAMKRAIADPEAALRRARPTARLQG
jgi:serine/threonine-protein kinase